MIVVPDNDYFYMVTLVGFITDQNHKIRRSEPEIITLLKQGRIVEYFRPSKIAINFVFI